MTREARKGTSFGIEQVINECGRAEVLEQGGTVCAVSDRTYIRFDKFF
jgi:hypothetical protein